MANTPFFWVLVGSAVLEVIILSIRLSHVCFVTKPNNVWRIFWYHTKQQSLQFLTPTAVGGRCPLLSEICAQSDPPPLKNTDFGRFPLITLRPLRDSEKSSIMMNRKSTTGFPMRYRLSYTSSHKITPMEHVLHGLSAIAELVIQDSWLQCTWSVVSVANVTECTWHTHKALVRC